MTIKDALHQLTGVFLEDEVNYGRLFAASRQLKALLQQLTNGDFQSREARSPLFFPNGKATGPFEAAMCLEDIMRTRQFMQGVYKAIGTRLASGKDTVHVLYAGTGPFATLVLPALFHYLPTQVRYTFVEINPLTVELLKQLLAAMDLREHSIQLLMADATQLVLDKTDLPDVVISETMQNNLAKEQQVSVYFNLMRQAPPTTIFVPERVDLYLGTMVAGVHPEALSYEHFKKVHKVFELSRNTLSAYFDGSELPPVLGENSVVLSAESQANCDQILLLTEITVFDDVLLRINESGLTTPTPVREITHIKPLTFTSRYCISDKPRLEYAISD